MTFKLNVEQMKEKHYLLPNKFIILFTISILILARLFFPPNLLVYQAINSKQNQPIAIFYLNKLIGYYPDNTELKLALVRQEIDQYRWSLAEFELVQLSKYKQLKNDIALLRFRFAYTQAFQDTDKEKKKIAFAALRNKLPSLSQLDLNSTQLSYLATVALSLNDSKTALDAYLRIARLKNIIDPVFLSRIGRVALSAKQYQISAQYYLLAAESEKTLDKKRQAIINALRSLLSGNLTQEGVVILKSLPENIWANKAMLVFMTQYALLANRPDLASDYIKRALLLPGI